MIEYIAFALITIFILYSFALNRHAVFFIVITNIIIFAVEMYYSYSNINILGTLGYSTANILSIQLVTGIFTHYDYIHILSNMVVLLFVGFPFEMRVGSRKFILIYLITGIIAEIIYSFVHYNADYILIGASGSIFGIMGTYLRLFPDDEISMFLGFIFFPKIKVKYAVFFATIIEILAMLLSYEENVAHLVHISAFLTGFFVAPLFIKTGIREYSIKDLEPLAKSEKSKELLGKIKEEKIEMVRKILVDEFLKESCSDYSRKGDTVKCNGRKFRL